VFFKKSENELGVTSWTKIWSVTIYRISGNVIVNGNDSRDIL